MATLPKKTCRVCDGSFAPDMMDGTRCKPCQSKENHEKRVGEVYGLAAGQYDQLLKYQGGVCYICQRKPVSKRLAVDHDHVSGRVRGLLCRGCNRDVLGHLRDDQEALKRAINYLAYPPAKWLWGEQVPVSPNRLTD